ncbi:MAG: DNA repair protein RadC [Bacteroidales bacterium]|nr:DNA repair protein RadC [Bacteroidales bacterium]
MKAVKRITEWSPEERPREKMISKGAAALTSAELLTILIKNGVRGKSTAYDIALDVLKHGGDTLSGVAKLTFENLTAINGVGPAKAAEILAAIEISRRVASAPLEEQQTVYSSNEVVSLMRPILQHLDYEECWVLYLNQSNGIIGKERVSLGGVRSTVVDIRIILKKAVEKLASGIIMVHNHPSGNRRPSQSDIKQTENLRDAARLFDINLIDHIIITKGKHFSFSDEGL